MRKILVVLLVCALVLPLLVINAVAKEPGDDFFIDPRLPAADKAKLRDVMRSLDPGDRNNVLYIDLEDGSFTANRLELIEEFKKQNEGKIDASGRLKKKAETLTQPASSGNYEANTDSLVRGDISTEGEFTTQGTWVHPSEQGEDAKSGPYRRVTSKLGYSRLLANIYLPDKAKGEVYIPSSASATKDKAYIYTGAVNVNGKQIDFGLAFNYEPDPGWEPWKETWGMILKGGEWESGEFKNFKMGTEVFLKYYTPQDHKAALYVAGVAKNGSPTDGTVVANVPESYNFNVNGTDMRMKRVTSIAQDPQNLNTGSFVKNVVWKNVKIGTTSGSEVPMDGTNSDKFVGFKIENVLVQYVSQSEETVWVATSNLP